MGPCIICNIMGGNSFLFNYLDNNLNKNITSDDIDGEGYLMHSGFFYKLSG
ncbi:MAG: hypothetical protein CM1200mP13_08370 [Candidatus Pelagibacterales bacterium]|nr:MAG: hypothetical protein CM1200mP13_08370 [Pelagibacterales bacterium]